MITSDNYFMFFDNAFLIVSLSYSVSTCYRPASNSQKTTAVYLERNQRQKLMERSPVATDLKPMYNIFYY